MSHLFISHSARDGAAVAQQLCTALEAAGHCCWIAPRDVKPGVPFPGQIVGAIRDCTGLVLVVTPAANASPDVLQEVQLAGQNRKTVAPVVVDLTTPSDDLQYYLGVRHQIQWRDARAATAELLRSFPANVQHQSAERQGSSQRERSNIPENHADDLVARFDVFLLKVGRHREDVVDMIVTYTGQDIEAAYRTFEGIPPYRVAVGLTSAHAADLIAALRDMDATVLDPVLTASQRRL